MLNFTFDFSNFFPVHTHTHANTTISRIRSTSNNNNQCGNGNNNNNGESGLAKRTENGWQRGALGGWLGPARLAFVPAFAAALVCV